MSYKFIYFLSMISLFKLFHIWFLKKAERSLSAWQWSYDHAALPPHLHRSFDIACSIKSIRLIITEHQTDNYIISCNERILFNCNNMIYFWWHLIILSMMAIDLDLSLWRWKNHPLTTKEGIPSRYINGFYISIVLQCSMNLQASQAKGMARERVSLAHAQSTSTHSHHATYISKHSNTK